MSFGGVFKPPKELEFTGNVAQRWRTFKAEFDIFLAATGLDDKSQRRQIMALLNIIGARGRAVHETFTFESTEANRTLVEVCGAFEQHCIPQQSELLERQIFRLRKQQEGESVNQFVSALRKLSISCNFGTAQDSVVRDQLVTGLLPDEKLADKLYDEPNLQLDRAVQICNTYELRQKRDSKSTDKPKVIAEEVNAVENRTQSRPDTGRRPRGRGFGRPRGRGARRGFGRSYTTMSDRAGGTSCEQCGYKEHRGPRCPAIGRQCTVCRRFNHFGSVCTSRQVHELDVEQASTYDSSEEDYDHTDDHFYVNALHSGRDNNKDWKVKVKVDNYECLFKIDTGSEVNTLPKWGFEKMVPKPKVKQTNGKLVGYFGKKTNPIGYDKFGG